jgi:hypothetical protein
MARKQVTPKPRKSKRVPLKHAHVLKPKAKKKGASVAARKIAKSPIGKQLVVGRAAEKAAPKKPAPASAPLAIFGPQIAKSPRTATAPRQVKASTSPAPHHSSPPVAEPKVVRTFAETPEEATEEFKEELRVHEEGEG